MARNKRGKRNSNYAQAVPGNTMTVTMPIQDLIYVKNSSGSLLNTPVVGSYEWRTVSCTDLLKKFPIKNFAGDVVPQSVKLVSVTVASATGFPGDFYTLYPHSVGAAVKFPNGQLFEQSAESTRLLKCRPSKVPYFTLGDDAFPAGTWSRVDDILLEEDAIFSYRGELKAVTLAFRLPDNVDLESQTIPV